MSHIKYFFIVYVSLTFISNAICIKCFSCRSSLDPKCADPFDNSTVPITNCQQKNDFLGLRPSTCRKIRQKVNGEWEYIRDCAYAGDGEIQGDEKLCLTRTDTNNIFVEYCTCNGKDGCNSASMKNPNLAFILLSTLVYFFIKMS